MRNLSSFRKVNSEKSFYILDSSYNLTSKNHNVLLQKFIMSFELLSNRSPILVPDSLLFEDQIAQRKSKLTKNRLVKKYQITIFQAPLFGICILILFFKVIF